jgi:Na+/melibiose symporter-like transporter
MPSSSTVASSVVQRHPSPPPGMVAIAFMVLFCAGLYPVTTFGGRPYFPGPWESAQTIASFFHLRPTAAQLCAFLQFGSAVPLGVFTATIVSRLRFLGVKAAGAHIALFGGFGAAFAIASSSMVLWTMSHSGIAQDATLTQALYFLSYGLGGPGYSVPLGLLMAGTSVPLLLYRLVPRWIPLLGLALAVCGELSWLNLEFPSTVLLIPLTRFPGFVWMIAVGFALPATTKPTGRSQSGG